MPFKEAIKRWRPEVIRLWLATAHYRRIVSFSEEALEQAESNLGRLINAVSLVKDVLRESEPSYKLSDEGIKALREMRIIRRRFYEAMNDDFNASAAFSHVYDLTSLVFKHLEARREYAVALRALGLFREFNEVLGVLDKHLQEAVTAVMPEDLLKVIIEVRSALRARKEYELADRIRDMLQELGIRLLDEGDRTRWILER